MKLQIKHIFFPIATLLLGGFLWSQNNFLTVNTIQYRNSKIPSEFEGFSILQISDLHNKEFGKDQKSLINKTKSLDPDIIVITGDLIDKRRTKLQDMDKCLAYVRTALEIAPVYFVTGNHESSSKIYRNLKKELKNMGVHVLDNKSEKIYKGQNAINLIGLNDVVLFNDNAEALEKNLKVLSSQNSDDLFSILLSHRPEYIRAYKESNVDLVLTGHTHGGQFRLPFIGGIIDTNTEEDAEGLLSGIHKRDATTMVISRGLGNSIIPLRFLNYPELIFIKLKCSE